MTRKEAAEKYPEIFTYHADTARLQVFVDNTLLSTVRKCEAFFIEWYAHGLEPRSREKTWNLKFGIWWHLCMKKFYESIMSGHEMSLLEMLEYARQQWAMEGMESLKGECEYYYNKTDGIIGGLIMLTDFIAAFGGGEEKLKIISCELSFGSGKEVPLLDWTINGHDSQRTNKYDLDMYLCGRPDVLVDNGRVIGPLDFKTSSRLDGRESNAYKPYDALAGYVYAVNKMLGEDFKKVGRAADTAFVLVIGKGMSTKSEKRFTRFPIMYSHSELEEYRLRQVATINRLYELLVLEEQPQWNTSMCNNDWFHDCQYKPLHNTPIEHRQMVIDTAFVHIKNRWNPSHREETRNV